VFRRGNNFKFRGTQTPIQVRRLKIPVGKIDDLVILEFSSDVKKLLAKYKAAFTAFDTNFAWYEIDDLANQLDFEDYIQRELQEKCLIKMKVREVRLAERVS
jgi:hypothetical protein